MVNYIFNSNVEEGNIIKFRIEFIFPSTYLRKREGERSEHFKRMHSSNSRELAESSRRDLNLQDCGDPQKQQISKVESSGQVLQNIARKEK